MKNWRVNLVFIFIFLFGAAIIGRLAYYQIIKHDFYRALAQGQQKIFNIVKGERGDIFFKGGEILATNVKGKYVFVSSNEIKEKEKTAEKLSQVLNLEKEKIWQKLNKDSLFEKIKSGLTEEEIQTIKNINLPGVYLEEAVFRNYPYGNMASDVVGFLGGEGIGQYGIEGFYDNILQGKERMQKKEKISNSFFSENIEDSIDGTDIILTLDYNIQFKAEKLLEKAGQDLEIEAGQIIVLDPNSGEIIALADYPSFDPNYYSEIEDFQIFKNGAIQERFEPGSVFKPITVAAALDQEKITPQSTYIDKGQVKIGKDTIYNYNNNVWGKQSMTEVLEKSINTGAVFVEKQLGHALFLQYVENFDFFEPTGIDLQGEVFSENKEFRKGYEINFATASFGQGIEMTPIQLVRAFSVIANGGNLIKPYMAEKTEILSRIISLKTASQTTAMLVSVVENGFSKAARIPGYYIAGKTGTAQVPWSILGINKKGYSDKTWQSFIGFSPAFNPRFLILVKLDNPKTRTAEYSALPIFKELAKYIINYWNIPPDYE